MRKIEKMFSAWSFNVQTSNNSISNLVIMAQGYFIVPGNQDKNIILSHRKMWLTIIYVGFTFALLLNYFIMLWLQQVFGWKNILMPKFGDDSTSVSLLDFDKIIKELCILCLQSPSVSPHGANFLSEQRCLEMIRQIWL